MDEANRAAGEILASERLAEHQARGKRALSKRQAEDLGADVDDQALVDAFADGMSYKDISRATGMTEAMVRTRLRRAHHRKLKPSKFKTQQVDDLVLEPNDETSSPQHPPPPRPPFEEPGVHDDEAPDDLVLVELEHEPEEDAEAEEEAIAPPVLEHEEDLVNEDKEKAIEPQGSPAWSWQTLPNLASLEGSPAISTSRIRAESDDAQWAHYETSPVKEQPGDWHPRTRTVYRLKPGTDFGPFGAAPEKGRRASKKRAEPRVTKGADKTALAELEAKVKDLESSLADAVRYCDAFDDTRQDLEIYKKACEVLMGGEESEEFQKSSESCDVVARAIIRKVRSKFSREAALVSHTERLEQLLASTGEELLIEEISEDWSSWFQVRKERAGLSFAELGECFGAGERAGRTFASGGDPVSDQADFTRLARALRVDPSILLAKSIARRMGIPATVELARAAAATLDKERHGHGVAVDEQGESLPKV